MPGTNLKTVLQTITSVFGNLRGGMNPIAVVNPIDHYGYTPDLTLFRFLGKTATSAITGFFVNLDGERVGAPFSTTIDTATAKSWTDIAGGALPAGAVGVVCDISADLAVDLFSSANGVTVMDSSSKANFPTITAGLGKTIGRAA